MMMHDESIEEDLLLKISNFAACFVVGMRPRFKERQQDVDVLTHSSITEIMN